MNFPNNLFTSFFLYRKRDKNDVGVVDGQAGRWKSGVQFVKKNDLKGFRMSKIKF